MRLRVSSSWLWLFVVVQVALPASYYFRDEPDEERFAWRMFSAVRLKHCEIEAHESRDTPGAQLVPIELASAVHASWQRSLERGRRGVIEHFLEQRCDGRAAAKTGPHGGGRTGHATSSSVAFAMLERRCIAPSGESLPVELYRYDCQAGTLERGHR